MKLGTKKLIRFDWALRTILREKKNFAILEGFFSELFKKDVSIERIDLLHDKYGVDNFVDVDILAQLASQEQVTIKLCVDPVWPSDARLLRTINCKLQTQAVKQSQFPRVISVNIAYFDLKHDQDYIYYGTTQITGEIT